MSYSYNPAFGYTEDGNGGRDRGSSPVRHGWGETETDWFPDVLTADMLRGFVRTERGCTHPRVGMIGGYKFIAKCGSWSEYSSDGHVRNEIVADAFLRMAGFNVPPSRGYCVDFGKGRGPEVVRLARYYDWLAPVMLVWNGAGRGLREKIRQQTVAAYPVQALIAGIDTFTWDNVKVDPDGVLWFVDNGSSFDYRACGKKKGWFWGRFAVDDPLTGYLALARHPDQVCLKQILGRKACPEELWAAARMFNLRELTRQLPDTHRGTELESYAHILDAFAAMKI